MSKRVSYALNIITLATWVSVGLGAAVGFSVRQEWTVAFPVKPEPLRIMTSIDIEPADAAPVEDTNAGEEIAMPQLMPIIAADPAPAPPVMPEIAPMAALPEIPELPAPVIRKTATQVAPSVPKTATKPSNTAVTSKAKKPTGNNPPATATSLSFGTGAGRQPAPVYPLQSRRSNQQGTVVIEFIVGTDGKVLSAWVKMPCPYELLNNAALSTIRSRWKFPSGDARRYKIPIIFRLN
jgi:TonB family protein